MFGGVGEEKERNCWVRGLELLKVFFLFCFLLGGEEGLGERELEKRLRVNEGVQHAGSIAFGL